METITAATVALNNLADTFASKKDEINEALADAQAGYAGLAANLKGVVSGVMKTSITFNPAAVAASLIGGGVFRNFGELMTFINAQPSGSTITILLPNGQTLTSTESFNPRVYGCRHLIFSSIDPAPAEANRPVYKIGIYDKVNNNQWHYLDPGNGGSVTFQNVNVTFDPDINPALTFSVARSMFSMSYDSDFSVHFNNVKVTGLAGHFLGFVFDAGSARLQLVNVKLDGPFVGLGRFSSSGTARLSALNVTLLNGATLHTSFTTGTNLQLG